MSMSLPVKIVAVHEALTRAGVPHAFGGALRWRGAPDAHAARSTST